MFTFERNEKRAFGAINANDLIDVRELFYVELCQSWVWGYDNLQLHCYDDTELSDFDEDDYRRELFAQVPEGGALLYDCSSNEHIIFTAQQMSEGVEFICIGGDDFVISDDDDNN